eukprot:RCo051364
MIARAKKRAWSRTGKEKMEAVGGGSGTGLAASLLAVGGAHVGQEVLADLLGIAEEHRRVGVEKHGVVHPRIPRGERALDDDHLFGLPDMQHGHPGNRGVGVCHRGAVHGVVGPQHNRDVRGGEILIDLVHLKHNVVRDARLGEQHVHMPRHASSHGVDRKPELHPVRGEEAEHLRDSVLGLRNSHTVTRNKDHGLRIDKQLGRLWGQDRGVGAGIADRHRPLPGAEASKQHADDVTVHRHAHDVRQDRPAAAHQRAHNDEQVVLQHEPISHGGPPGVAVQHGNHHRHVGTPDTRNHQQPKDEGGEGVPAEVDQAGALLPSDHVEPHRGDDGEEQAKVEEVAALEHQRLGAHQGLQLRKRHQAAREGHPPNEHPQVDRGLANLAHAAGEGRLVQQVGNGDPNGGETHEAVEQRDQLRELSDAHFARNGCPNQRRSRRRNDELSEHNGGAQGHGVVHL